MGQSSFLNTFDTNRAGLPNSVSSSFVSHVLPIALPKNVGPPWLVGNPSMAFYMFRVLLLAGKWSLIGGQAEFEIRRNSKWQK